jgi:hypothetical protein
MKKVVLYRNTYLNPEILGHLMVFDEKPDGSSTLIFECKTLELGYKNNQKSISSVPAGFYELKFEYSPKFNRRLWELKGVPNRSEAKIHPANFYKDLNGCIGLGDLHVNVNNDGILDLRNSKSTLKRFHKAMDEQEFSSIRIIGTN